MIGLTGEKANCVVAVGTGIEASFLSLNMLIEPPHVVIVACIELVNESPPGRRLDHTIDHSVLDCVCVVVWHHIVVVIIINYLLRLLAVTHCCVTARAHYLVIRLIN